MSGDTPEMADMPPEAASTDRATRKRKPRPPSTGSLTRRMIVISTIWIVILLSGGAYALDRVLNAAITRNFDDNLNYVLTALVATSEVGPDGELLLAELPADQRFLTPYSGLYFQVSAQGREPFPSRSLWDRTLDTSRPIPEAEVQYLNTSEFETETLRVAEREVRLPGSDLLWRFQVAQDRVDLDKQIYELRTTMLISFGILALGLIVLAALQTIYGLWPLRKVRRAIVAIRSGEKARIDERLPREIAPLTEEVNQLLAHNERQAEEARRHAGNLAHALKTPLTVITNASAAKSPDLPATVMQEARTMRRQVDHHLARARAVGRRSSAQARTEVWPALKAVERAVSVLYENVTIDLTGDKKAMARVERQDLDELLGNLIENAAKYGGGRVFVTVKATSECVEIEVEDDGTGIPESQRIAIFDRGARLDTGKPGTGLGLAIVRDVAEIYGGSVTLEESEDLGGLLARLRLPIAEPPKRA